VFQKGKKKKVGGPPVSTMGKVVERNRKSSFGPVCTKKRKKKKTLQSLACLKSHSPEKSFKWPQPVKEKRKKGVCGQTFTPPCPPQKHKGAQANGGGGRIGGHTMVSHPFSWGKQWGYFQYGIHLRQEEKKEGGRTISHFTHRCRQRKEGDGCSMWGDHPPGEGEETSIC